MKDLAAVKADMKADSKIAAASAKWLSFRMIGQRRIAVQHHIDRIVATFTSDVA